MNNLYQIFLPRAEWETIMYNLTHFDGDHQRIVNAFLRKIKQDIRVIQENNRDTIYSDRLDDASILEALCNTDCKQQSQILEASRNYVILTNTILDVHQNNNRESADNRNGYRDLLNSTHQEITTYSTQVIVDTLQAT